MTSTNTESLFATWLERIEAGEKADLDELCREHPEHAAELHALHAKWHRIQGALDPLESAEVDGSGNGSTSHTTPESTGRAPVDFSPKVLARLLAKPPGSTRYSPRDEIARGGMGAVLRVWDEELNRPLAMKVMLRQGVAKSDSDLPSGDARLLARFLEEAQVTGQLDHPGIVPVHELGLDAEGRVFFTMKLVKGKTLREVFDELARGEGGWTGTRVLGLLQKVCEAMSYAHHKDVIHRDLKPSNVMVGRFGEVYVMDWGLAKVLGHADESDERLRVSEEPLTEEITSVRREESGDTPDSPLLTMEGDVVGTPAYMPPEQARGDIGAMGPHSDVYAVGAMLYHALAGHMPYVPPGRTVTSRGVWARVQAGPPEPLSKEAPAAPAELVALCEKAMAREVEERYADMSALASDLTAYLEGRVVGAYETGAWAEARKWVRRNKPLAATIAATVVSLVIGLLSSLVLKAQADERAEEVLRLAGLQDLQALVDEADDLWPPYPERIEELRAWIAKAEALEAEVPAHRATLEQLRSRAPAQDSEEGGQVRWWTAQLTELIERLEALENPETGLLSPEGALPGHGWSVRKRLAFAQDLEAGFTEGGTYARVWAEALPAIRRAYPDVNLTPQMGLLPIGPDPKSGLWEFAHLMTGVPAKRGPDGKLDPREEMGVVLVLLPGGTFWMGAQRNDPDGRNYDPQAEDDEGPVHEVELSPFFVSKYELTQGQWLRTTGHNPSFFQPPSKRAPSFLHPAEQISWEDWMQWLSRVRLRLPSEAEWEYAARGGTDTPWWTGAERESLEERHAANLEDLSRARARKPGANERAWPEFDDGFVDHAPVGTFSANGYGLHEITGNLFEACLDGYDRDYYAKSPRKDPVSPWSAKQTLVDRGGGFNFGPELTRSASRTVTRSDQTHYNLGARPVMVIEP